MSIRLILNMTDIVEMPFTKEGLLAMQSSKYPFVARQVASRLRHHFDKFTEIQIEQFDQYIESFTFETEMIEESGEEIESGGGSTISLNDDVSADDIMLRFLQDMDPMDNGGVEVKYGALAQWHKGFLHITYITVEKE